MPNSLQLRPPKGTSCSIDFPIQTYLGYQDSEDYGFGYWMVGFPKLLWLIDHQLSTFLTDHHAPLRMHHAAFN